MGQDGKGVTTNRVPSATQSIPNLPLIPLEMSFIAFGLKVNPKSVLSRRDVRVPLEVTENANVGKFFAVAVSGQGEQEGPL